MGYSVFGNDKLDSSDIIFHKRSCYIYICLTFVSFTGFTSTVTTTKHSKDTEPKQRSSCDRETALIVSLTISIFIILLLLLMIFRAKVNQCLIKLSRDEKVEFQEETEENGERIAPQNYINLEPVNISPQNMDENIYADLNSADREPENIYQSLKPK